MKTYRRWQEEKIADRLRIMRVVVISGARQCGKTTLAQEIAGPNNQYITLDDKDQLVTANLDPKTFVKHTKDIMVIDEIQRSPDLILAIKSAVDKAPDKPGQFLLTGSANILALPSIPDSLAGRAAYVRLRPLAQGEIMNNKATFVKRAFAGDFAGYESTFSRRDIIELAFKGGFPDAIKRNDDDRVIWQEAYVQTLIERELKDIADVRKIDVLKDLLNMLAAWSSKFLDITSVACKLEIARETVSTYINILEYMYIVEHVPHWKQSDYKYATKQSKFFMTDTGLMVSLLGWDLKNALSDADKSGKLIETYVFNQLSAQIEAQNQRCDLYHYRDHKQREIDFLLSGPDDALVGIEVKAGTNIGEDDFKHLRWFKENIAKKKPFVGIVLYTGSRSINLKNGFWAVPMGALFE